MEAAVVEVMPTSEHDALISKLEAEVEHYNAAISASEGGFPFTSAVAARNRLQALLDEAKGEKP